MAELRIYVAGPYSGATAEEIEKNVERAIDAGLSLVKRGHLPFIPHLTHFVDLRAKEIGCPMEWKDYIRWDSGWLEVCDALLFLGDSPGASIELEAAKRMNLAIYYDLSEVPQYVGALS